MLTADKDGLFRADNHGWFFGWTDGTLFQVRGCSVEVSQEYPLQIATVGHCCW